MPGSFLNANALMDVASHPTVAGVMAVAGSNASLRSEQTSLD
jgi:hypothetical protein